MLEKKISLAKWEAIRIACVEGGFTLRQASEHYGVSLDAIKTKCYRENWQTPSVLKERAALALREVKKEELEQLKEKIREDRVDYVAKREEHRKRMMQVSDDVLTKLIDNGFEHLKIKSVRDLDVLDTIMRRTLGIDLEDAADAKLMTLDFSNVKPASAVIELDN